MNFVERADAFLNDYQKEYDFYGSVRVTHKGKIVYEKMMRYSNRETGTRIERDSVFTLYSMSKPLCVIGLLKFYDKGILDIDKHPGEYVKEAKGFDESVTIRHMLHHISGLPDFGQLPDFKEKYAPGTPEKIREHLEILKSYPMNFKPGTDTMYANINMILCALICENLSGLSYPEYMKKEVFEPLGMKSAYIDNGEHCEKRVSGHIKENDKIYCTEPSRDWMMGAGDAAATVDDIYCLNIAIKERLLLKSGTWDMILTATPVNGYFGMGCMVGNDYRGRKKKITHNGGSIGFRTMHVQLPEDDFDVILLSNCDWVDGRHHIVNNLHDIYYDEKNKVSSQPELDKGYI